MMEKKYRLKVGGYLLIVMGSIIFWISLFNQINQPNPDEKIQLFISAESYDQSLLENIESISNDEILDISIVCVPTSDDDYNATLLTQGMLESDLLILPKTVLDASDDSSFVPLTSTFLIDNQIDDSSLVFYSIDTINYAIQVYDGLTKTNLLPGLVTFDESDSNDYFLVLNNISSNLGVYGDTSKDYNEVGLLIMKYLINTTDQSRN